MIARLVSMLAVAFAVASIGGVDAQASTLGKCADLKQLAELDRSTAMVPAIVSRVIEMPQPIFTAFWKKVWLWPTWDRAYLEVNNTTPLQVCDKPLTRSETDLPWPGPYSQPANITEIVIGIDETPGVYKISLSTDAPTIRFTRLDASFEAIPNLTSEDADTDDDSDVADASKVLANGHTLVWTRERAIGKAVDFSPGHWEYDFVWMANKFFDGATCLGRVYQKQLEKAGNDPSKVKELDADLVALMCGAKTNGDHKQHDKQMRRRMRHSRLPRHLWNKKTVEQRPY